MEIDRLAAVTRHVVIVMSQKTAAAWRHRPPTNDFRCSFRCLLRDAHLVIQDWAIKPTQCAQISSSRQRPPITSIVTYISEWVGVKSSAIEEAQIKCCRCHSLGDVGAMHNRTLTVDALSFTICKLFRIDRRLNIRSLINPCLFNITRLTSLDVHNLAKLTLNPIYSKVKTKIFEFAHSGLTKWLYEASGWRALMSRKSLCQIRFYNKPEIHKLKTKQ